MKFREKHGWRGCSGQHVHFTDYCVHGSSTSQELCRTFLLKHLSRSSSRECNLCRELSSNLLISARNGPRESWNFAPRVVAEGSVEFTMESEKFKGVNILASNCWGRIKTFLHSIRIFSNNFFHPLRPFLGRSLILLLLLSLRGILERKTKCCGRLFVSLNHCPPPRGALALYPGFSKYIGIRTEILSE